MAPTSWPKAPGSRVKINRPDAPELAKHLAYESHSIVSIPTVEDEDVKDYIGILNTRAEARKKAKQNLFSFLLRKGKSFSEGRAYWTQINWRWLKRQQLTDPQEKLSWFNWCIEEIVQDKRWANEWASYATLGVWNLHIAFTGQWDRLLLPLLNILRAISWWRF